METQLFPACHHPVTRPSHRGGPEKCLNCPAVLPARQPRPADAVASVIWGGFGILMAAFILFTLVAAILGIK